MVSSKADAGAIQIMVTPRSVLLPARAVIAASVLSGKEQRPHQKRGLRLLPCPLLAHSGHRELHRTMSAIRG